MKVGDLVKHKEHEQYGIVENILCFHVHAREYAVVFWQCGSRSGMYTSGLEVIDENR